MEPTTILIIIACLFVGSLFLGAGKFFLRLLQMALKVFWLAIKLTFKALGYTIFYGSRFITLPFRRCFPPKGIDAMNGLDFEDFSAKWLGLEGYRSIRLTPASGDYGVDITAIKDGVRIGVQCKRYSGNVGVAAVQEITAGLSYYECEKGIVLTNAGFTDSAVKLAAANGIELIDGSDLKSSRAAASLLRGRFSLFCSAVIMAIFSILETVLCIWVYVNARVWLPLAAMLLIISLLCLLNAWLELKDRSLDKKEVQPKEINRTA